VLEDVDALDRDDDRVEGEQARIDVRADRDALKRRRLLVAFRPGRRRDRFP
jgi:hypothetical protein